MVVSIPKAEGGFVRLEGPKSYGRFEGTVKKIDLSEKKGPSGYPYLIFVIDLDEDHEVFPGAREWWKPSLSPKVVNNLRRFCREAGMDVPPEGEDWKFKDAKEMLRVLRDNLIGVRAEWVREPQEDNPRFANVNDVHVAGQGAGNGGEEAGEDPFTW